MNDTELAELLDRYQKGECTPEDAEQINAWYERYGKGADFVSSLAKEEASALIEGVYQRILSSIDTEKKVIPIRKSQTVWVSIAAAVVLLLLFKFFVPQTSVQDNRSARLGRSLFINQSKVIHKIVLPDRSTVWLNPGATLAFPKTFNTQVRRVEMSGDCFFEVTKDKNKPFLIFSEHLITRVWGTSFRVSDSKNSINGKVSVLTGKVSVQLNEGAYSGKAKKVQKEVILTPNQRVIYQAVDQSLSEGLETDKASMAKWNRQKFTFDGASVSEIISLLNKRYNVRIDVKDEKIRHSIFSGDLTDFNLPEVLEVFKRSLGIKYEMNDEKIILKY